jgi:type II restriction enzyme
MALTGNRGEWSELYALFKILGDKELHPGDASLNRIQKIVYPVIEVLRLEAGVERRYSFDSNLVVVSADGNEACRMSVERFMHQAQVLFSEINAGVGSAFEAVNTQSFLDKIKCVALKAGSSDKSDITVIIHDSRVSSEQQLGFSIKSQLGSASTLLNASGATLFIYEIERGLTEEDVERINGINTKTKIGDRVNAIIDAGGILKFRRVSSSIFENNLVMIDSCMPEILAEMLLIHRTEKESTLSNLTALLKENNPIGFDTESGHNFYEYKIKRLLTDSALGMVPQTRWEGRYDATGGYIVVKSDGDVVCYHIYDKNAFEDYLLHNTKIETPSSSRHDFGSLYREDGKLFFALCLQIRFKH